MIVIKNVKGLDKFHEKFEIDSADDVEIDAEGKLTLLPALIDPHVHFRTPGAEHKENWNTGAQAAIAGGVTFVFDMPNNNPACVSKEALESKIHIIQTQLREVEIPLRYRLFLGADKDHLEEIGKSKKDIIGVKIYMGSSTGNLVVDDPDTLDRVFQICAQEDLVVAVHAEDEQTIQHNLQKYSSQTDPSIHSKIRNRSAAVKATMQAIELAEKYSGQLYVLHVSTKEEIELIQQAKQNGILVYAEVTPHHLFLTEEDYKQWGTKVQVNPPIRTQEDQDALWKGIEDGIVDSIGSDHAPHTIEEKNQPYGKAPSGVPGVETTLPLLLNAHNKGKISLEKIVELTRLNLEEIYRLEHSQDMILVDLDLEKEVKPQNLKTRCHWSPYSGRILKGWPLYTILKGKVYRNE